MDACNNRDSIKNLDISRGVLRNRPMFAEVCLFFLRKNLGPRELAIEIMDNDAATIVEAMAANTSLKALMVDHVDESGLIAFAKGVAKMRCKNKCRYSNAFFHVLLDSLEHNTALWAVSFDGIMPSDAPASCLARIRYLLALNRIGHQRLFIIMLKNKMPKGLWAPVLAKVSSAPDGIYHILTEMPDMLLTFRTDTW